MSVGYWRPTARLWVLAVPSAARTVGSRPNCTNAAVPLEVVENALILAVARRLARPADATPLGIIRSLAYFAPVIEQLLHREVDPEYFRHLRNRIIRLTPTS